MVVFLAVVVVLLVLFDDVARTVAFVRTSKYAKIIDGLKFFTSFLYLSQYICALVWS